MYIVHVAPCTCTIMCLCYMCSYNVEDDQVTCFIRIPMEKIEKIVVGEPRTASVAKHNHVYDSPLLTAPSYSHPHIPSPSISPCFSTFLPSPPPRSPGHHHPQLQEALPEALLYSHGQQAVLLHLQDCQVHLNGGGQR